MTAETSDTDDTIDRHLAALGIASPSDAGFVPVADELWQQLTVDGGAHVPPVVRRFFRRYAGGAFPEGAWYPDPQAGGDVMLGWFLDETELVEAIDATRDVLPADVVPVANDGGDNHVAVAVGPTNAGTVYFHVHDAPLDSNLYVLADSFEGFLLSLHPA